MQNMFFVGLLSFVVVAAAATAAAAAIVVVAAAAVACWIDVCSFTYSILK